MTEHEPPEDRLTTTLPRRPAFCPRCGRPFPAAGACPADGYRWFADAKVAVGVLVEHGGRLLLVKRAHDPALGRWAFPSGWVDAGEVLEEAAAREVREETGIEVRIERLVGAWSEPGSPAAFLAYAATAPAGEARPSAEASEVAWFDLDALPPLAFEHDPAIVAAWRAARDAPARDAPARGGAAPGRPVTLLQQRGIEAEVLIPFIRRLEGELGTERAHALARAAIEDVAREQGRRVADAQRAAGFERNGIEGFREVKDSWGGAGGDLRIETLREDGERLEFNVVGCRFAELYRRLGAADLGFVLSCARDFALSEGYSPALRLERTQTIMQGAAFCDFRYRLAAGPAGDTATAHAERDGAIPDGAVPGGAAPGSARHGDGDDREDA